jgi:hypothetical protein
MRTVCLLLVGVVVGWAASEVDWSREAVGQDAARSTEPSGIEAAGPELKRKIGEWTKEAAEYSQINRYQVSSYGTQVSNGCYVIDSTSGKVWHLSFNGKSQLVAGELPEK